MPGTPPEDGPQTCNRAQSLNLALHDHDSIFNTCADNAEVCLHLVESATSTHITPQMSRTNTSRTQGHLNKPITPGCFEYGHNSTFKTNEDLYTLLVSAALQPSFEYTIAHSDQSFHNGQFYPPGFVQVQVSITFRIHQGQHATPTHRTCSARCGVLIGSQPQPLFPAHL